MLARGSAYAMATIALAPSSTALASATAPGPAGLPAPGPQGRIVGGAPTNIRTVPWQVSVWSRGGPDGGFDCGGSIIAANTIVTAAHCVDGAQIGDDPNEGGLGIDAGISHLTRDALGDNFQDSVVESARIHPQWTPAYVRTAGDLAVLTIDPPLVLDGATTKAIALPPDQPIGDEPLFVGASVIVSGFGRQLGGEAPSGELFALDAVIDYPTVCPGDDNAAALCARTPAGAACSGDSGGPLATRTNPPVLIGVVSNGPSGCPPGEGESYVNLAVPENRRFLAGSANPPIAPRQTAELSFGSSGGVPLVGQPFFCSASFNGSPSLRWTIKSDAGVVVASTTGSGPISYRPTEADVGHELSCVVTASNAGGVAVAGPAVTPGPIQRPRAQDPTRPQTQTPFRLGEAVLTATAAKTIKRGKVLLVSVKLTNLFGTAETGTVCVKQGAAKPKCVAPDLKTLAETTLAFRFRIAKRTRAKSLQTFAVTATLAGRNPNSGRVEQVSRSTAVRARVSR